MKGLSVRVCRAYREISFFPILQSHPVQSIPLPVWSVARWFDPLKGYTRQPHSVYSKYHNRLHQTPPRHTFHLHFLTLFMRFFRHDNHLLWFSILAFVTVSMYAITSLIMSQTSAKPKLQSSVTAATTTTPTSSVAPNSSSSSSEKESVLENASDSRTGGSGPATMQSQPNHRKVRFDLPSSTSESLEEQPPSSQLQHPPTTTTHNNHSQVASSTPQVVYLDIAKQDFLKSPLLGRVVIRLYPKQAPRTAYNFARLCAEKKYVNIPFHRVVKDFMIQGGDIANQDGTGTYTAFGGEGSTFEDEPFLLTHSRAGLLSMANAGPNTNGSQFFILTNPAPHLDGKHVVFGEVVEGMQFVKDIEREVTDPTDRPVRKCYVLDCGVAETSGTASVDGSAVASSTPPHTMHQMSSPHQQQAIPLTGGAREEHLGGHIGGGMTPTGNSAHLQMDMQSVDQGPAPFAF
jgi:cyclophilin family peptidyl-prolyl cis-trans isomerase